MHIFIPLLQILLTCLFTLHPRSRPPISQKPPIWIPSHNSIFSETHSIAYSRILLTFTNPSVSSISNSARQGGNSLLTDETRKARQYAARYIPYLLMHFCSLHLVGRMTSEIRKGLLPGIWACIELVPREALRGMNSGMGRDERAVWASLWAEWCRTHNYSTE